MHIQVRMMYTTTEATLCTRTIDSFITFIKVGQQTASRITSPQPYTFHCSLFILSRLSRYLYHIIRRDIVEPASVSAPPLFLSLSPGPALRGPAHHTWQDVGTGRRVL